jgi:tRNA threonylcarbamoyladenosine biosynthesis protein TsaE
LTQAELEEWGERFGAAARPPLVVAISGDLGAGKTTLVRAICRGAGVRDEVTSPTFSLVHLYAGPAFPIYHLDLYRVESPEELTNIGWDDLIADHAIVLVEWPERAGARLPPAVVPIDLEHLEGDESRRVLMAG